jgi:hypothetical protein
MPETSFELEEKKSTIDLENNNATRQKKHHEKIVWMHFVSIVIGAWLMSAPLTFNYESTILEMNDVVCGLLIILLGSLSIHPFRYWAPWGCGIIGLWLNLAPLIFWAPNSFVYHNETFSGILIIVFSFILPGVPGSKYYEKSGPSVPQGWTFNPSSWLQRAPVITLAWIGFFSSRYLASYQLGYINEAWDPFFIEGTEKVLNSSVSKAWPVSDAGLGAFSYLLDALMGYIGGENRWRTMPWVVIIFGILIIPLGAVSIILIILQPLVVGAWCSLCLFTALTMLIMIPVTFDEILASIQFLNRKKSEGKSFWKVFFYGGGEAENDPTNSIKHKWSSPLSYTFKAVFEGFIIPWNLSLSALIGIWIMLSPAVIGYAGTMADNYHIIGALVVTCSVIAMGEIVRVARFLNVILGLWILFIPFLLSESSTGSLLNGVFSSVLLILISFRKGKVKDKYGDFDKYIV